MRRRDLKYYIGDPDSWMYKGSVPPSVGHMKLVTGNTDFSKLIHAFKPREHLLNFSILSTPIRNPTRLVIGCTPRKYIIILWGVRDDFLIQKVCI